MTNRWDPAELQAIADTAQIDIGPLRADGSMRPYKTVWIVRVADDLYVRSYRGRNGDWYRGVMHTHRARIRFAGTDRDVTVEDAGDVDRRAIDDAYRSKYARHARTYVEPMVSPAVAETTLRLLPHVETQENHSGRN